jgi:hypothetical protein
MWLSKRIAAINNVIPIGCKNSETFINHAWEYVVQFFYDPKRLVHHLLAIFTPSALAFDPAPR